MATDTLAAPATPALGQRASGQSAWRRVARRIWRDKVGLAGMLLVLAVVVIALLAPLVAPYDPVETHLDLLFAIYQSLRFRCLRNDETLVFVDLAVICPFVNTHFL